MAKRNPIFVTPLDIICPNCNHVGPWGDFIVTFLGGCAGWGDEGCTCSAEKEWICPKCGARE